MFLTVRTSGLDVFVHSFIYLNGFIDSLHGVENSTIVCRRLESDQNGSCFLEKSSDDFLNHPVQVVKRWQFFSSLNKIS